MYMTSCLSNKHDIAVKTIIRKRYLKFNLHMKV